MSMQVSLLIELSLRFLVALQNLLKIFHTPTHYTTPCRPKLKMAGPIEDLTLQKITATCS